GGRGAQEELGVEARRHGDLLQGPFPDTYGGLLLKTLLLLRWAASRCPQASFLLKADDDVFVNTPALMSYLIKHGEDPLYLGRVHWGVRPQRDPRSRHHVPPS
ncbi:B3GT4 galactosyltransferase, partial [Thinocorus orbignyianus]|nr:B3GT4 galactosyltransferase [Thinocorus orbignyianus]